MENTADAIVKHVRLQRIDEQVLNNSKMERRLSLNLAGRMKCN